MYTQEKTVSRSKSVESLSWRTGARAKGSLAVPSPHSLNPNFNSGSVAQRLANRKAYIDLIDANLVSQPSAKKISITDTGHNYTKIVKTLGGFGGYYKQTDRTGATLSNVTGLFCGLATSYVPNFIPALTTGNRVVPTGLTPVPYNQRSINAAANDMAVQPSLPIAETIVELLTGNIPSMIKSFNKNLSKFERLQQSGADYLSIQFAWKPLVSDFIKVVNTLMAADHIVYGQKFRRSREIREVFNFASVESKNTSFTSGWRRTPTGGFASNGQVFDSTHRMSHRINARMNSGARPSRKQYGFYDKAQEFMFQLGFNEPSLGWQLSRFSWLIDWAVDIGGSIDLAANFSAQTGRYPLDYSYLSTKSTTTVVSRPRGNPRVRTGSGLARFESFTSTGVSVCFVFNRQNLSLFRPGFSLNNLNGFQYSILVALGLAKSR